MRLHVHGDRRLASAAAPSTRYLHIAFTAPERERRARRTLGVALVLDRSGSMAGEKFTLARQAVDRCLGLLSARDAAALVVFDTEVDVLQGIGGATAEHRRVAMGRLGEIGPRGSTDLCAGWHVGATQVAHAAPMPDLQRVILLTDGLANHGVVTPDAITHLVAQARAAGIVTSTFGVGADFDERLLEGMAEAGGGNFYYLQRAEAMLEMLTTELGDALEIVARDAAIVLDVDEDITVECPSGWRVTRAGRRVQVALGDIVSGQEMELVLALRLPRRGLKATARVRVSFADREEAIEATDAELTWLFASKKEADAEVPSAVVMRAVAQAYAARARREAVEHNREGRLAEGRRVLEGVARRIAGYAGNDVALQQLVVQLTNEAREHEREFSVMELKERHFSAYAARNSRDEEGRSRRRR